MSLKATLSNDLKAAMRAGDSVRRDALRGVLTAITSAEVNRVDTKKADAARSDLADPEVLDVLQKQAKQRRESIEEFKKANRQDLIDREQAELAVLEAYLPAQMSRDDIAAEVRATIAEVGASGPGDKGKVMPAVMGKLKGRADGRIINEVVTELLAGS